MGGSNRAERRDPAVLVGRFSPLPDLAATGRAPQGCPVERVIALAQRQVGHCGHYPCGVHGSNQSSAIPQARPLSSRGHRPRRSGAPRSCSLRGRFRTLGRRSFASGLVCRLVSRTAAGGDGGLASLSGRFSAANAGHAPWSGPAGPVCRDVQISTCACCIRLCLGLWLGLVAGDGSFLSAFRRLVLSGRVYFLDQARAQFKPVVRWTRSWLVGQHRGIGAARSDGEILPLRRTAGCGGRFDVSSDSACITAE